MSAQTNNSNHPRAAAPRAATQSRWAPGLLLLGALAGAVLAPAGSPAQTGSPPAPKLVINEDCAAYAFAPDSNHIVYAVRHVYNAGHLQLQRDDIWTATLDGKPRRIVNGQKLVRGAQAFSYAIRAVRWSPDGALLTVEMLTSQMIDEKGNTQEGELTDLMDAEGREIKIQGGDSAIDGALQATWLADGVTVVYLREAVKPELLFTMESVRPVAGRGAAIFPGHYYSAVAWDARRNAAVAIERDRSLSGPIRLVWLDLIKQTTRDLGVLAGYVGHLTLSPRATKVAYFSDGDTLEIRDVAQPDHVARIPLAYGRFQWTPDEHRLLLKRGPDKESNDLVWVSLPDGKFRPALQALVYHDFEISPDGRWVAVTEPGKHSLRVYPME